MCDNNDSFVKDTLTTYRNEIHRSVYDPVEDEIVKKLLSQLNDTETAEEEKTAIRNQLIGCHLRFVNWMADRMWKGLLGAAPEVPLEDLVQAGNVGLIRAIDNYDVSYLESDIKFISYAWRRVEGAIKDEIEKNWRNHMLSLDDENGQALNIEDERDEAIVNIITKEKDRTIALAVDSLKPIEKRVLEMFYGIEDAAEVERVPIHKIAKELGMSNTDVKYIKEMAEQKLKKELGK